MAKQAQQSPATQPQAEGKRQRVELTLGSSRDVPMLAANKVVVNFTGTDFLVSVLAAYPEPWTGGPKSPPPKVVEAKVLARYAFSVAEWVAAVRSFSQQVERLQAEGAFKVEFSEEEQ